MSQRVNQNPAEKLLNIEENCHVWDKQQTITEIVADNLGVVADNGAKSDRKFSLNIERVDHANSHEDTQEALVLDDRSLRDKSKEADPRSERKQGQLTDREGV